MSFWDWLTAAGNNIEAPLGWAEEARGMHTITTSVPGYTANEVKRELRRQGVKVGRSVIRTGDEVVITVDDTDRAWRVIGRL